MSPFSLGKKFAFLLILFLFVLLFVIGLYALSMRRSLEYLGLLHISSLPRYSSTLALQSHFSLYARLYEDAALLGERILLEQTKFEHIVLWQTLDTLYTQVPQRHYTHLDSLKIDLLSYEKSASRLAEILLIHGPEGDLSDINTQQVAQLSAQVGLLRNRLDSALSQQVLWANEDLKNRLSSTEYELRAGFVKILGFSALATLFLSILLSLFTRRMVKPIQELSLLTAEVAGGKWVGSPIDISSGDEVGELARNFETMRLGLQKTAVSKAFVDRIFDSMGEALFVLSQQGKVVRYNSASGKLLGNTEELAGVDFISLCSETEQASISLQENPGEAIELELKTYGGQSLPVLVTITPLQSPLGIPDGWVVIARDITERKKAQEELESQAAELRRSNEELEQFAYVASHDLQEPLRMVASYLQLLEKRYKEQLDQPAREFIFYAVDGATRMKGLINDLLAYSRLGTRVGNFEWVPLEDLVQESLSDLSELVKESQACITWDNLPQVFCYPRHLAQLLQNILGNALKYRSKKTPEIHLGFARKAGQNLFWVKDNGIGMKEEYLEKIFIIFQRLHTRQEYAGTGIGLAICKKIVEKAGGKIWAKSVLGEGTTFYWTWPRVK